MSRGRLVATGLRAMLMEIVRGCSFARGRVRKMGFVLEAILFMRMSLVLVV